MARHRLAACTITLIALASILIGCAVTSDGNGTPTMSADDPAAKQVCFANQVAGQTEVFVWVNEGGRPMTGATVDGLVKVGALSKPVVCPAGGDFVFNPNDCTFTCSIHGWAPDGY
ncbi:MAG: hypothetical protein OEV43_06150 [Coriobacteriia bacterium]|nr:hypothetical protein [Coriobacteriia bacterium]